MSKTKFMPSVKSKRSAIFKTLKETLPFVLSGVFLCAVVYLISFFESYTFSEKEADRHTADALSSTEEHFFKAEHDENVKANTAPYITDTRTVAEYENGLGIYDCFGELIETFETNLSLLSAADRKLLKEGIVFDSEGEMRDFLESFGS